MLRGREGVCHVTKFFFLDYNIISRAWNVSLKLIHFFVKICSIKLSRVPAMCLLLLNHASEAKILLLLYYLLRRCSENNVMRFLFGLLRTKGIYVFLTLLAHPREALHKRHLVYCLRVMSVGCSRVKVELSSWCSQLT
jgi:hypothetical protein